MSKKNMPRHSAAPLIILLLSFSLAVHAGERPARTLKIKIVADQHFASQEVWERRALRQIEDITEEIRGLMEVDLKIIAYEEWNHGDEDDLYALASRLVLDVSPDSADALIGFTFIPCPPEGSGTHTDGVTIPFRGMMIRNYYPACDRNRITPYAIIHEMIHLFGGVHIGPGHLMSAVLEGEVMLDLDPLNRRIVQLTRDIDFEVGYESLDPHTLETIADLYLQAIENGNRDILLLYNLGEIYTLLGQYDSGKLIYGTLLKIDSTSTRSWLGLADNYIQGTDTASAISILERSLDHDVDSGSIWHRMARIYYDLGDYEQAYDYATRAAWQGFAIDSIFRRRLEEIRNATDRQQRRLPDRK